MNTYLVFWKRHSFYSHKTLPQNVCDITHLPAQDPFSNTPNPQQELMVPSGGGRRRNNFPGIQSIQYTEESCVNLCNAQ